MKPGRGAKGKRGTEGRCDPLVSGLSMSRRSLRPHLNQIRGWVRQGRTDAWVAHQLEVTVQQVDSFKREHELLTEGDGASPADQPSFGEIDLRAEDDALIAAELEAAEQAEPAISEPEDDEPEDESDEGTPGRRRRGRRGGRGRRRQTVSALEGTFDHGEEGYGLWLDPAVQDDPVYAEHWAGHRPVVVTIDAEQIVIRRGGEEAADDTTD